MRSLLRQPGFCAAAILVLVLVAYAGSLTAPWVLDDSLSVTANPSIRKGWDVGAVLLPPADSTVGGRPVANLTFAVNYAVSGSAVWSYHLLNVLLHGVTALAVFGVVRRSLRPTVIVAQATDDRNGGTLDSADRTTIPTAFAVAVVWALHPLMTASVAYVSQRTEVLMGMFAALTLYTGSRFMRGEGPRWGVLSVVACWLGMASKEGMVVVPVLVLLYDRCFVAGTFTQAWRQRRFYYLSLALSWVLLATLMAGLSRRAVGFGLGVTWWRYAMTEFEAVTTYARLVAWPHPLVFDYGPLLPATVAVTTAYALGIAAAVGFTVWLLVVRPRAGFALAAFFLLLAPTSSVVPVSAQPIAENRPYLASAGLIAAAMAGWAARERRLSGAGVAMVVVGLIVLTTSRVAVFRDPVRLWTDTIAKRPQNARAYSNLGEVRVAAGDMSGAVTAYETALKLKPDYPEPCNNLGVVLAQMGNIDAACLQFARAIELRPDFVSAYSNWGTALLRAGRPAEARDKFRRAYDLASLTQTISADWPGILNGVGESSLQLGEVGEAMPFLRRAVLADPSSADLHMNLGVALNAAGELVEARRELEESLRLRPEFVQAHYNLALVCARLGDLENTRLHLEKAVGANPRFVPALRALGKLYEQQGQREQAVRYFKAALDLLPGDPELQAKVQGSAPTATFR